MVSLELIGFIMETKHLGPKSKDSQTSSVNDSFPTEAFVKTNFTLSRCLREVNTVKSN